MSGTKREIDSRIASWFVTVASLLAAAHVNRGLKKSLGYPLEMVSKKLDSAGCGTSGGLLTRRFGMSENQCGIYGRVFELPC